MDERSTNLIIKFLVPFVIVFLIIVMKKGFKNYKKEAKKSDIEVFKLNADKILVNLSDAEISSVYHTQTLEDAECFKEKTINHIFFNKTYNDNVEKYINTWRNEVKLKGINYKQSNIDYEFIVYMDKPKLKTWFIFNKETYLYINPENQQMYLDLEFTNE